MDLAQLLDTYRGPLIGLVVSWGASWADAEEVAQESFAQAWLGRHRCRGDWRSAEVFGAWLRGIARGTWRNHRRARIRRERRIRSSEEALAPAIARDATEPTEDTLAVRRAIERLPARSREVVLMHHLEGSPVADVAALLGTTAKTVEGRLYQARKRLRRILAPGGDRVIGTGVFL